MTGFNERMESMAHERTMKVMAALRSRTAKAEAEAMSSAEAVKLSEEQLKTVKADLAAAMKTISELREHISKLTSQGEKRSARPKMHIQVSTDPNDEPTPKS